MLSAYHVRNLQARVTVSLSLLEDRSVRTSAMKNASTVIGSTERSKVVNGVRISCAQRVSIDSLVERTRLVLVLHA